MTMNRVHSGVPTGGQFAAGQRGESDVALDAPIPPRQDAAALMAAIKRDELGVQFEAGRILGVELTEKFPEVRYLLLETTYGASGDFAASGLLDGDGRAIEGFDPTDHLVEGYSTQDLVDPLISMGGWERYYGADDVATGGETVMDLHKSRDWGRADFDAPPAPEPPNPFAHLPGPIAELAEQIRSNKEMRDGHLNDSAREAFTGDEIEQHNRDVRAATAESDEELGRLLAAMQDAPVDTRSRSQRLYEMQNAVGMDAVAAMAAKVRSRWPNAKHVLVQRNLDSEDRDYGADAVFDEKHQLITDGWMDLYGADDSPCVDSGDLHGYEWHHYAQHVDTYNDSPDHLIAIAQEHVRADIDGARLIDLDAVLSKTPRWS
ncbi:MAG: hypothetical protein WKF57_03910 [Nakamurella sp.]